MFVSSVLPYQRSESPFDEKTPINEFKQLVIDDKTTPMATSILRDGHSLAERKKFHGETLDSKLISHKSPQLNQVTSKTACAPEKSKWDAFSSTWSTPMGAGTASFVSTLKLRTYKKGDSQVQVISKEEVKSPSSLPEARVSAKEEPPIVYNRRRAFSIWEEEPEEACSSSAAKKMQALEEEFYYSIDQADSEDD